MPMPAHLEAWWREHPKRWSQRRRHAHGFPAEGSRGQQIDWFRRQFLKLADKALSAKERGDWLKMAFMATLKGEDKSSDSQTQYIQYLTQKIEELERAHMLEPREPAITPMTDRQTEILRYFQNTTYRKRDKGTQNDPHPTDRR